MNKLEDKLHRRGEGLLYLDKDKTEVSSVNSFLECRDGVVEYIEYTDMSRYGDHTRLFLCRDTKHETVSIVRQYYSSMDKKWYEETLSFDSDSYEYLELLLGARDKSIYGGEIKVYRDYGKD